MLKNCFVIACLALGLSTGYESAQAQSPSAYALIRKPVFEDPLVWKLTRQEANSSWSVDLFNNPVSGSSSYIIPPWLELWSGVSFELDKGWNRILYVEAMDDWIRAYSSFGSSGCQVKWPQSIDVLAPCNDSGYSIYYYGYVADTRNNRIVRFRYNWQTQVMVCDPAITGLGLDRPVDLDLNDGGDFWEIGEGSANYEDNYLWVVNAPNGGAYQIKRIVTYNGALKSTFGTYGCTGIAGQFCRITAIASSRSPFLVSAPYANTTHFYVADPGNNRIVWLIKETNGETISWMGEVTCGSGNIDLEVDAFGHLWALDRDAGRVTKYAPLGMFPLCTFGSTGIGENQFMLPNSIGGHVGYLGCSNMFVIDDWSDSSGIQYFAIGTDVVDFSVTSSLDKYFHYVNFVLIDPSKVLIDVYNSQGGLVKHILNAAILSGSCMYSWDGKNTAGVEQPTGEYRVVIVDTSSVYDMETGARANVVTKEAWFHHEFHCCIGIRGNVNGDVPQAVNVVDVTYLVAYLFQGGPPPPCKEEADMNLSNNVNVVDLTALINYVFNSGPPPPACP